MEQAPAPNSYYQFYQSQFHNPVPNPNPNPNTIDPQISPWPTASASAPPVVSSDYPNYYPPYPANSDQLLNSTPTAPAATPAPAYANPSPQYPPPTHHPYDQNQPSYYPYGQNQPASAPAPVPTQSYSGPSPQYSAPPVPPYDSYEDGVNYERWGGYSDENSNRYGEHTAYGSEGYSDDGVYRYEGGKVEPYGARGTASFTKTSSQVMFDDYGRPISLSNGNGVDQGGSKAPKVVRAVPKTDTEEDVKCGVQKFRVKLLSEGFGQSDQDVLCQV